MGAQNSNLRQSISDEFDRLRSESRDWLVLEDMLTLRLPHCSWTVDPAHLGVLHSIDANHDGRFELHEMHAFVDLCGERARKFQPHEFPAKMAAYCMLQMWQTVMAPNGRDALVSWISKLVAECADTATFDSYPGHVYVNRDVVETLHELLHVADTQGIGFQAFFDVLQRNAEDKGLLDLQSDALDDWVPLQVIQDFMRNLIEGMAKVVSDIYPSDNVVGLGT